eukprot:2632726-Rhodomonas_salina.3
MTLQHSFADKVRVRFADSAAPLRGRLLCPRRSIRWDSSLVWMTGMAKSRGWWGKVAGEGRGTRGAGV